MLYMYLVQLSLLVMQQLKNVLQEGEETHELALRQGTLDPMEGENCVLYVHACQGFIIGGGLEFSPPSHNSPHRNLQIEYGY